MRREQQITQASQGRFPEWGEQAHALELAFQAGCHWSDSHPHWISVEDALPKERDWYLIYDTNMGHDVCMWYGDCWGNCYKVTHWMPLPAPPKEIKGNLEKISPNRMSSSESPNNCKTKGGEQFEFADEHPVDLESTEGASLDALFDGGPVKEIDDIIDNLQQK